MSYTLEISQITVVDELDNPIAKLEWMNSESIDVTLTGCCTNSKDWPEVSDAIKSAIVQMERSSAQYQKKVNA